MNKTMAIRIPIVLIGIFLIFMGIYNIFLDLQEYLIATIGGDSLMGEDQFSGMFVSGIIIVWGFLMYYIGRHWKNSLKNLSKLMIHFTVFCISLAIMFFPFHSNTGEFVDSIQPSIDLLIGSLDIESIFSDAGLEVQYGKKVTVLVNSNDESELFEANSITLDQANFLINKLGISGTYSNEDKIYIGQFLITYVYDQIKVNQPNLLNSAILIDTLIDLFEEENKAILGNLDSNSLNSIKNFYTINENAEIKLIREKTGELELTIGDLSDEEISLIWNTLDLEEGMSIDSKKKSLDLLFSAIVVDLENRGLQDLPLPLTTLKSIIPQDYKDLFSYDLLNENKTIVASELSKIRNDCEKGSIGITELCEQILISRYDNFVNYVINISKDEDNEEGFPNLEGLESFNTLEKLESELNDKTKFYSFWFVFGIIFFIISLVFYGAHFFVFHDEEDFPIIQIPYDIFKWHFFSYVPSFILFAIFYLVMSSGILLEEAAKLMQNDNLGIIEIIPTLPIYDALMNVISEIFRLSLIYFSVSLVLFICLFALIRIKKSQLHEENS